MIPVADALNHHPDNNACLKYASKYNDHVLLVAMKHVKKVLELFTVFSFKIFHAEQPFFYLGRTNI